MQQQQQLPWSQDPPGLAAPANCMLGAGMLAPDPSTMMMQMMMSMLQQQLQSAIDDKEKAVHIAKEAQEEASALKRALDEARAETERAQAGAERAKAQAAEEAEKAKAAKAEASRSFALSSLSSPVMIKAGVFSAFALSTKSAVGYTTASLEKAPVATSLLVGFVVATLAAAAVGVARSSAAVSFIEARRHRPMADGGELQGLLQDLAAARAAQNDGAGLRLLRD